MSVRFFLRPYPSANAMLLTGTRPVLVDPGYGPDFGPLTQWLGTELPALVFNTHWHMDHAGANHLLPAPIAASAAEAAIVNAGTGDASRGHYLRQVVAPYRVDRPLHPGDVVDTGAARWTVLALPGHTTEQIGLFNATEGVLIAGDALHATDLGWLDVAADPAALERAEATIESIAALPVRLALSGHGPAMTDVPGALSRARRRLASWRQQPQRIAWHACKRIFTHALMTADGLARAEVAPNLLDAPWFRDHAQRAFAVAPEAFVPPLLEEMLRSGAAAWVADRLVATTPYRRENGAAAPG